MARRGPKEITDEHKAAMAAGRTEGRAIKKYLEALELHRPRRGRRRTEESITARLDKITQEIDSVTDPVKRLNLIQERLDLVIELTSMTAAQTGDSPADLEPAFIAAAKAYSDRKHISYAAWREIGVSAATLKAAGISRSS